MNNDDDKLMFEAYMNSLMSEAPIGGGPSFDEPYEPDEDDTSRLDKYSKGTLDSESLQQIVSKIKDFLNDQPNNIFPGDVEEFRKEIKLIILDVSNDSETSLKINPTNANYLARVVRNGLDRVGVIDVNVSGDKIEVQDVNDDDIESAVEDGMEEIVDSKPEAVPSIKFNKNDEYNVDPLAADALPQQHREIAEYVSDHDGKTGREIIEVLKLKIMFNTPEAGGGFDGNESKLIRVLNDLVTAGVMVPVDKTKSSEDDEAVAIDTNDPDDVERADRDFIDNAVKQAEWGSQTPLYGLED